MTYNEAEERAARLWTDVVSVSRLRYNPEKWEVVIEAVHGRHPRRFHVMDAQGHPICHTDCIAREDDLGSVDV